MWQWRAFAAAEADGFVPLFPHEDVPAVGAYPWANVKDPAPADAKGSSKTKSCTAARPRHVAGERGAVWRFHPGLESSSTIGNNGVGLQLLTQAIRPSMAWSCKSSTALLRQEQMPAED